MLQVVAEVKEQKLKLLESLLKEQETVVYCLNQ